MPQEEGAAQAKAWREEELQPQLLEPSRPQVSTDLRSVVFNVIFLAQHLKIQTFHTRPRISGFS